MRQALASVALALGLLACADPVSSRDSALTGTVTVLRSLDSDTGTTPRDGLSLGPDGMLWGSAWQRGPNRLDPPTGSCSSTGNWSSDYQSRYCPGTVFRVSPDGSVFEVVHAFTTLDASLRNADGYQPTSAPIYGGDGWMYGTTSKGGQPGASATAAGVGVLYRINVQTLEFQVVHAFCSLARCADGSYSYGGLRNDGRGHLLLAVKAGGNGSGVVDVLDLVTQQLSVVRAFGPVTYVRDSTGKVIDSYNADGGNPFGPPVVGWDGLIHVAPPAWGPQGDQGTLLSLGFDGTERLDAEFPKQATPINADNASMGTMIVSGRDGHLLGFRGAGGLNATGSIIEANADGSGEREVFSFDTTSVNTPTGHYSNATGALPQGTLLEDYDGALIGTTYYGGSVGRGVAFRITRDGVEQVLVSFTGNGGPQYTSSGFTRGPDGRLYGASQSGGANGPGCIYRLDLQ